MIFQDIYVEASALILVFLNRQIEESARVKVDVHAASVSSILV